MLWSRTLPCGQEMKLSAGKGSEYLKWDNYIFGSDSIIASFRYKRYGHMIRRVMETVGDYRKFFESYLHRSCTIGGYMIFPKHNRSINQCRGTNPYICDRWDLSLECIRLYYNGVKDPQHNPLGDCLKADEAFFNLFVDFKGFVDFFLLNDCVTEDYRVRFWLPTEGFVRDPLPRSVSEYLIWIENELAFVEMRNRRIAALAEKKI